MGLFRGRGQTSCPTSPYQLLQDPNAQRKRSETPSPAAQEKAIAASPSPDYPSAPPTSLSGGHAMAPASSSNDLDGVLYSSSPCATDVVATADLPLSAKLHPRVLTIKAPAGVRWKLAFTYSGNQPA